MSNQKLEIQWSIKSIGLWRDKYFDYGEFVSDYVLRLLLRPSIRIPIHIPSNHHDKFFTYIYYDDGTLYEQAEVENV